MGRRGVGCCCRWVLCCRDLLLALQWVCLSHRSSLRMGWGVGLIPSLGGSS